MSNGRPREDGHGKGWRSWVPVTMTAPMLLLIFLLPSALNLPQSPPQQTLEFAPVPPSDEDPPPPDSGNVSNLGLGSTSTGPTDTRLGQDPGSPQPPAPPPPPPVFGDGARPVTKRCVGSPPRQTEDPMSPPCVGYFEGDNGGATAPGVSQNEVVILVYIQAQDISAAFACHDSGCDVEQFYDLGLPPEESPYDEIEAVWPHVYRVWQTYFNERFQLYGRRAHVWVHFGRLDNSPESRIADVADAAEALDPFAIVADVDINGQVYAHEWANRGRAVFMSKTSALEEVGFDESFFQRHPGQVWDYQPSIQEMSDNLGSVLCSQVVGHPVSFSGDGTIRQQRRFGLLVSSHPNFKNRVDYAALVRGHLERCGANIAAIEQDDYDGSTDPVGNLTTSQAERTAQMATMRDKGVTTILNLSSAFHYSKGASAQVPPWRPEWIVQLDNVTAISISEDPSVFEYARNFTIWPRAAQGSDRPCEWAFSEVDPTTTDSGGARFSEAGIVCISYNSVRMLFTGIQVAGPRLTVKSIDVGMHAIPAIPSGDVRVPACFYRPGDYTCVKDAQIQRWDPSGTTDRTSESAGCWVSIADGRRYLPGQWPVQDVEVARKPTDTCNLNY